ncbi:MAG TPA: hypothetical protein VNL38_04250, partial [Candidatus Nitrosotenuis sp.]|nr:hypothetical protein [Candidatus Nitrosotenuis sp.]
SELARAKGIALQSLKPRLERLLTSLNGTRASFERTVPGRGGRGGRIRQFNVFLLAQKFPEFLTAEDAEKLTGNLKPATCQPETSIIVTQNAFLERPVKSVQSADKPSAPSAPSAVSLSLPFGDARAEASLRAIENPRQRAWAEARHRVIEKIESGEWKLFRGQVIHGIRVEKLDDFICALAKDSRAKNPLLLDWRAIEHDLRVALGEKNARLAPVAPSTIWKWHSSYSKGRVVAGRRVAGIEALADAPPATAGRSKFADAFPEAAAWFVQKVLVEGLNRRHAYDLFRREWPGLRVDFSTLRRLVNRPEYLPAHIKKLFELGPRKYFAERGPSILRERQQPGEWLVLDHRQHDVHVANDLFEELEPMARCRLWLTCVLDWGSDFIAGYCFSPTPSSVTINSALRMAFGYGAAPNLLWDRGEDFKRTKRVLEADEALNSVLRGRVTITQALPYNARAKVIESRFGAIFARRFDREWTVSGAYAGRNTLARSESCAHALQRHEKFLAGKASSTTLPPASTFIAQAVAAIEEHNDTPKDFLGGRAPRELFLEAAAKLPQLDRATLDALFSLRDSRVIGRGGTVKLNTLIYQPLLEDQVALSGREGSELRIARDAYNLREASAYDPATGALVGRLEIQTPAPQSAHGQDPLSLEAMKALNRRRKALRRDAAAYVSALSLLSRERGWQSALEARADRHALAAVNVRAAAPGARPILDAAPKKELASPFVSDAVRAANFWEDGE